MRLLTQAPHPPLVWSCVDFDVLRESVASHLRESDTTAAEVGVLEGGEVVFCEAFGMVHGRETGTAMHNGRNGAAFDHSTNRPRTDGEVFRELRDIHEPRGMIKDESHESPTVAKVPDRSNTVTRFSSQPAKGARRQGRPSALPRTRLAGLGSSNGPVSGQATLVPATRAAL